MAIPSKTGRRHPAVAIVTAVAALWLAVPSALAQVAPAATSPAAVRSVVHDYVGLYRKDTLEQWRSLFLPSFTATSPGADGAVTVRTLDEFYESQARGFARAAEMSETLENVVIEQSGRLATAWADFVFRQDGTSRRGRLVLALVETKATWRIASVNVLVLNLGPASWSVVVLNRAHALVSQGAGRGVVDAHR